jgi:hypothetical protein
MSMSKRFVPQVDPKKFLAVYEFGFEYLDKPVPEGKLLIGKTEYIVPDHPIRRLAHCFMKYFPDEVSYTAATMRYMSLLQTLRDNRLSPWVNESGEPHFALIEAAAIVPLQLPELTFGEEALREEAERRG